MLLPLVALAVGGLIGLASGGKLRHAAGRRIAWWWLLVAGFGLELAADRWLTGSWGYVAMIAGPLCLLGWAAGNARLTGVVFVALGVFANALVLAVDQGMPVEHAALVRAAVVSSKTAAVTLSGHRHHLASAADHLRFLDDRIALGPTRQVVSIGDVILAVGTASLVVHLLHYQPRYQRSRRPRWAAEGIGERLARTLERRGPSVT
ncbi:MAG: DUF5317 domain-containing protein [Acidimicrobiaceae bacterium]|nr:DUF5317 domain-containing protein [Acidimicrobiaceae bacterium]